MAFATTTLTSAVLVTDNSIVVASATSLAPGRIVKVDGEYMQVGQAYVTASLTVPVLRGRDGSVTAAHPSTANVTHGLASDFALPAAGVGASVTTSPAVAFTTASYSAAGAIAFGAAQFTTAIINGTSALAMTLANPTKDQDGIMLLIASNGKAAHTVTYTAGLGNAGSSYDVLTYTTGALQSCFLTAVNGFWLQASCTLSGTLTAISIAIA